MASSGVIYNLRQDAFQPPRFNTQGGDESKYKVYSLCSFLGHHPFERYDVCGFNFTAAVSRYFKARLDEQNLYRSQLKLMNLFPHVNSHVVSLAGCTIETCEGKQDSILVMRPTIPYGHGRHLKHVSNSYTIPRMDDRWSTLRQYYLRITDPYVRMSTFDYLRYSISKYGMAVYNSLVNGTSKVLLPVSSFIVARVYEPLYEFVERTSWLKFRVQLPHPKRMLYTAMVSDDDRLSKILDNKVSPESKIKREPSKFGKAPRLYSTFNEGALVEPILPELAKKCMKHDFCVSDYLPNSRGIRFTISFQDSQESSQSDVMYRRAHSLQPNEVLACYYSDDGFIACRDESGFLTVFETDISGCDSSNGPAVFNTVYAILQSLSLDKGKSMRSSLDAIFIQCAMITKFINPSNPREFIFMRPEGFFEYSGSCLTTVLNNVSVVNFFFAYYLALVDNPLSMFSELVQPAASDVGLLVTCDLWDNFNQNSFLKRAYCVECQRSYKVYGALFRSLGVVDYPLTHLSFGVSNSVFRSSTLDSLFSIHLRQRLDSESNEPVSVVINAFRMRCGLEEMPIVLPTNSLCQRYSCEDYEIYEFCNLLQDVRLGDIVCCSFLCKMFSKDYGVNL